MGGAPSGIGGVILGIGGVRCTSPHLGQRAIAKAVTAGCYRILQVKGDG